MVSLAAEKEKSSHLEEGLRVPTNTKYYSGGRYYKVNEMRTGLVQPCAPARELPITTNDLRLILPTTYYLLVLCLCYRPKDVRVRGFVYQCHAVIPGE